MSSLRSLRDRLRDRSYIHVSPRGPTQRHYGQGDSTPGMGYPYNVPSSAPTYMALGPSSYEPRPGFMNTDDDEYEPHYGHNCHTQHRAMPWRAPLPHGAVPELVLPTYENDRVLHRLAEKLRYGASQANQELVFAEEQALGDASYDTPFESDDAYVEGVQEFLAHVPFLGAVATGVQSEEDVEDALSSLEQTTMCGELSPPMLIADPDAGVAADWWGGAGDDGGFGHGPSQPLDAIVDEAMPGASTADAMHGPAGFIDDVVADSVPTPGPLEHEAELVQPGYLDPFAMQQQALDEQMQQLLNPWGMPGPMG